MFLGEKIYKYLNLQPQLARTNAISLNFPHFCFPFSAPSKIMVRISNGQVLNLTKRTISGPLPVYLKKVKKFIKMHEVEEGK